jgi:hypothetical protein
LKNLHTKEVSEMLTEEVTYKVPETGAPVL